MGPGVNVNKKSGVDRFPFAYIVSIRLARIGLFCPRFSLFSNGCDGETVLTFHLIPSLIVNTDGGSSST